MKIGWQIAIASLAIGSFAAGYGVSFLRYGRVTEPDEAYINYMRQCVFLGDTEDRCAEEWRLMDTPERFIYTEAGRRAHQISAKRDVKKKSVQRLNAKPKAEKTNRVRLSSS